MEYFVLEMTARAAAGLTVVEVNTAALFYRKIRIVNANQLGREASGFAAEVELDKSYFGGVPEG